eukprot:scaffold8374_cov175-Amphora_coffeaeformis.AAC.75
MSLDAAITDDLFLVNGDVGAAHCLVVVFCYADSAERGYYAVYVTRLLVCLSRLTERRPRGGQEAAAKRPRNNSMARYGSGTHATLKFTVFLCEQVEFFRNSGSRNPVRGDSSGPSGGYLLWFQNHTTS